MPGNMTWNTVNPSKSDLTLAVNKLVIAHQAKTVTGIEGGSGGKFDCGTKDSRKRKYSMT